MEDRLGDMSKTISDCQDQIVKLQKEKAYWKERTSNIRDQRKDEKKVVDQLKDISATSLFNMISDDRIPLHLVYKALKKNDKWMEGLADLVCARLFMK